MLTLSIYILQVINLSNFPKNPSLTQFIPGIYDKIIIKILGYFWGVTNHVYFSCLKFLAPTRALGKLQTHDVSNCIVCKLEKFSALPFNRSVSISSSPFDLIHYDVWGPSPIPIKEKYRYYVSFIDDHTFYYWVYLMKHRFEFFKIYKAFRGFAKTQHSVVIKCFRCELGGEYTSNKFLELLALDGRMQQTSCKDTFEQNSVAERKHRHIVETARFLLLSSYVPSEFWGESSYYCSLD